MIGESDTGLRERLQATIDHVAQQPGAQRLCLALALAEGFTFQLVVCNSPRVAAALQLWLEEAVAIERGKSIRVERLSPYPLDPSAAGPVSLDASDLTQSVLEPLGQRTDVGERIACIDASWAKPRDAEAWRWLLLRLNERRNAVARGLGAPLTFIIPPLLELDVARLAPDLWSIRSLVVQVDDLDMGMTGASLLQSFEDSFRTVEDIAVLQQEVERARTHAEGGGDLAQRALRVLLLRLAGAKQRIGELDVAEQLIDEATELADGESLVACKLARSDLLVFRGDLDAARRIVESTIPVLLQSGDHWTLAAAWDRLADILYTRGEFDEALRIRRAQQLPIYERLGDVRLRAVTMGQVADVLEAKGEFDEALRIRREDELPVYEKLGDLRAWAITMAQVADILIERSELDEGLRIYRGQALPIFEKLGDRRSRAVALARVANVLAARGEFDEALRILREQVLAVFEELGDVRLVVGGRAQLAVALAQRGLEMDVAEIQRLLALALKDARRLQLPNAGQIEDMIQSLGGDPDAPPFA